MIDIGLFGAFIGGILSFVSPCVLPLVPPYLCYVAGLSVEELGQEGSEALHRRHVIASALSFVFGFSTVFVALGATASVFGQAIRRLTTFELGFFGFDVPIVALVAGLVIAVMGLHFLGVVRISFLYREARLKVNAKPPGLLGGYVLGLAFAFGWTPCIGPVLAAILALAGSEDTVANGAFLLFVYSLGLGVPFLVAAAFAPNFIGWSMRFRRHLPAVEKTMGAFLVLTGILFITGQMTAFAYWLLETFPALGVVG